MSQEDDVRQAVDAEIEVAASKREKYGHPDPDRSEADPEHPGTGFTRWIQKGGHLDPAAEEQHPEYLALFKKLGGNDAGVTLKSGERVERARVGEAPPANREQPTTDPENAEIEAGAKVLKTGQYEDAKPVPKEPETPPVSQTAHNQEKQGLTKKTSPRLSSKS